jgi:hypothetical protein
MKDLGSEALQQLFMREGSFGHERRPFWGNEMNAISIVSFKKPSKWDSTVEWDS